ncbi:MAG: hypothetical protein PHQ86_04455 [Dehalococcoidales bacterium]|nr:hypothetical protein [Dehalococcoidales bacterium]
MSIKITNLVKIMCVLTIIVSMTMILGTSLSCSTYLPESSTHKTNAAPLLAEGKPIINTTDFGNIVVEGIVRNDGAAKATWI